MGNFPYRLREGARGSVSPLSTATKCFWGNSTRIPRPRLANIQSGACGERSEFGATFSKVPLIEAAKHPESVRKWLYRLATQSPDDVGLDADGLSDLRRDASAKAREGLAQGAVDLSPLIYGNEIMEWYSVEDDRRVRGNLLVSMASRNAESELYAEAVRAQFAKEAPDSTMRHHLLAASVGSLLYQNLRAIDVAAERARQGLLEYGDIGSSINIYMNGETILGNQINAGRDINAQAVAGGNIIGSANAAIQKLERTDAVTAKALKEVLAILEISKNSPGNAEIAEAVKAVAGAPTTANKKSLLERLKGYTTAAAAAGTILLNGDKVIHSLEELCS